METEINRLNSIVETFTKMSKAENLNLQWCSIGKIIKEVFDVFEQEAKKNNISLKIHLAPALPSIYCDRKLLKQVFVNLVSNSIYAMPKGGLIKVNIEHNIKSDNIIIKFADTGVGIPKENLDKIFDLYFTTRKDGTGLGLSIVHQIIKSHNGNIDVISEINKGTMFVIELPVTGPLKKDI